ESALLADERERRAQLAALFTLDPAFAIWSIAESGGLSQADPPIAWTIGKVVSQVADSLPERLATLLSEESSGSSTHSVPPLEPTALARETVDGAEAAGAAATLAGESNQVTGEAAYLAALWQNGLPWLRLSNEVPLSDNELASLANSLTLVFPLPTQPHP